MDIKINTAVSSDDAILHNVGHLNRDRNLILESLFDRLFVLGEIYFSFGQEDFLAHVRILDAADIDIDFLVIFFRFFKVEVVVIYKFMTGNFTLRFVADIHVDEFIVITDNAALDNRTTFELRNSLDIIGEVDIAHGFAPGFFHGLFLWLFCGLLSVSFSVHFLGHVISGFVSRFLRKLKISFCLALIGVSFYSLKFLFVFLLDAEILVFCHYLNNLPDHTFRC